MNWLTPWIWLNPWIPALVPWVLVACVPRDPPEGKTADVSSVTARPIELQRWRPHPTTRAKSTQNPNRLEGGTLANVGQADALLTAPFYDDFQRDGLGTNWISASEQWRIESGQLCGQSNRNRPVWLKRRIPLNARITFVARARSANGDLKVEAWGDGKSYATATSYDDATSYLFILGGWKNRLHVLARKNEHDAQRLELRIDQASGDHRLLPVLPNVDYRFVIERRDGKTIAWSVNDVELFAFADPEPLLGPGHDHFAFNNWESPACFDDLTITPLPE